MRRDARATWAKRVERWGASGLSAAEFALEIGVNARTLTYRKWKLGTPDPRRAPPRPEFVEVVATSPQALGDRSLDALEVVLVGGVVIRVPARFDAEALRRLGPERGLGFDVVDYSETSAPLSLNYTASLSTNGARGELLVRGGQRFSIARSWASTTAGPLLTRVRWRERELYRVCAGVDRRVRGRLVML